MSLVQIYKGPIKVRMAIEIRAMVTYLEGCFWPTEQQA